MRREVFDSLQLNTKAEVIGDFGEFIASRSHYGYNVYLYAMPGFFVEVFYSGYFLSQIEYIRIQDDYEVLAEYVKDTDLHIK